MTAVPGIEHYPEGTSSEERYGFTRVVAAGNVVVTSGTTAASGEDAASDAHGQTTSVMRRLLTNLERAGAGPYSVFRVQAYARDIGDADEILRGIREALGSNRPAVTLVETALVSDAALVEIALDAYRPAGGSRTG